MERSDSIFDGLGLLASPLTAHKVASVVGMLDMVMSKIDGPCSSRSIESYIVGWVQVQRQSIHQTLVVGNVRHSGESYAAAVYLIGCYRLP
jgi:hypothetical protein